MRFLGAGGKMGFGNKYDEVFLGGLFTSINYKNSVGFVNPNHVAVWRNNNTWGLLGSGVGENARGGVVLDSDNNLYVGGAFTTAGGSAANRIAVWRNNNTWGTLGDGLNNNVSALALDSDNNLYVGGAFTTANGSSANYVAVWRNNNTWGSLGSGMNGGVNDLAFDSFGNLYVGGGFTTAGGIDALRTAIWNGSSWEQFVDTSLSVQVILPVGPRPLRP